MPRVRRSALLLAALLTATVAAPSPARADDKRHVLVDVGPAQGALPTLLRAEAKKARAEGRRAFAYVHASWCGPCHHLEDTLAADPRVQRAFRAVRVVRLDNDAWGDALPRAGLTRNSMPKFFELDADGKPTGRVIDGRAWNDGKPQTIAAALDAFFHPR